MKGIVFRTYSDFFRLYVANYINNVWIYQHLICLWEIHWCVQGHIVTSSNYLNLFQSLYSCRRTEISFLDFTQFHVYSCQGKLPSFTFRGKCENDFLAQCMILCMILCMFLACMTVEISQWLNLFNLQKWNANGMNESCVML